MLEQPLELRTRQVVAGALLEQRLELVERLRRVGQLVEVASRDLDAELASFDRRQRGQSPTPQRDQIAPPLLSLEQASQRRFELGVAAVELELLDHVIGRALLLIGEVLGHVGRVVEQPLARVLVGRDRERAVVDGEQLVPTPPLQSA